MPREQVLTTYWKFSVYVAISLRSGIDHTQVAATALKYIPPRTSSVESLLMGHCACGLHYAPAFHARNRRKKLQWSSKACCVAAHSFLRSSSHGCSVDTHRTSSCCGELHKRRTLRGEEAGAGPVDLTKAGEG